MTQCPNCGQQLAAGSNDGNAMSLSCPHCGCALPGPGGAGSDAGGYPLPAAQPITPDFAVAAYQPQPETAASAPVAAEPGTVASNPQVAPAAAAVQQVPMAQAVPAPYGTESPLPKGMAVASMVLGIIAILGCWIPLFNVVALVLGILALILGIVALRRVKRRRGSGKGMGIAGIVLGVFSVALSALVAVALVLFVQSGRSYEEAYDSVASFLESASGSDAVQTDGDGAPTFDDDASWTSLRFTMGDAHFQLGVTTLEEFGEQSGWSLDLAAQGYPDGYIVEPSEEIVAISLTSEDYPDDTVQVSVVNESKDQRDLMKCQLSEVVITNLSGDLTCTLAEDVGIGSTIDQVIDAYGKPSYSYGSAEGGYRSINYDTADYDKEVEFTATEGSVIDRIMIDMA